jgi:hypothetical protein
VTVRYSLAKSQSKTHVRTEGNYRSIAEIQMQRGMPSGYALHPAIGSVTLNSDTHENI